MKIIRNTKAFTILEVLIAASIFVIVASISVNILVRTIQTERKTEIRNALYEDGRIVMEQLTNAIRSGTIDYEEYFSQYVTQEKYIVENGKTKAFGLYSGVYHSRFFHPGRSYDGATQPEGVNPEDLGAECALPNISSPLDQCQITYSDSVDLNTNQNPYEGSSQPDYNQANAICDGDLTGCSANSDLPIRSGRLYLISESDQGIEKTIFAKQKIKENGSKSSYALAYLVLEGIDSDSNGVVDIFSCKKDDIVSFNCNLDVETDPASATTIYNRYFQGLEKNTAGDEYMSEALISQLELAIQSEETLDEVFQFDKDFGFIPLTPFRTNIYNLEFLITPPENPYLADAESEIQIHPYVTILLTIRPSAEQMARYPGLKDESDLEVTLQRTVSTGLHGSIQSYEPTSEVHWICGVLNDGACPEATTP